MKRGFFGYGEKVRFDRNGKSSRVGRVFIGTFRRNEGSPWLKEKAGSEGSGASKVTDRQY